MLATGMRRNTLILLAAVCGIAGCALRTPYVADAVPTSLAGERWDLVWNDEFAGTAIDPAKWTVLGDSVRRQGYWSREDAFLDGDGHLVLRTRRHDDRVYSGALSSEGKFERRFGLWVMRCRFGTQPGHWPAFWLYSESVQNIGDEGRDGTEIDIVEKLSTTEDVDHNLHWDGYDDAHQTVGTRVHIDGINEGFHTFAVYWTSTEYVFFVDGRETWRTAAGGVSQVPQFVLITDEVDEVAGNIDAARLPDALVVDWLRVYSASSDP